jgi:hypothetical protein|tara:strand:+ start:253 stop:483 length:231 start_codon:yes stop_codon:yes gene_type:complete
MNKYTEADVNRTHKGMVEDLIDHCIKNWKNCTTPLRSRMWYAVASQLESIKEADYSSYDMERILEQANMNAQKQEQ